MPELLSIPEKEKKGWTDTRPQPFVFQEWTVARVLADLKSTIDLIAPTTDIVWPFLVQSGSHWLEQVSIPNTSLVMYTSLI